STFPGKVHLTGWNPLIPRDDKNSSIPAAFIEISVTNTTGEAIDYSVAGSLRNSYDKSVNEHRTTETGTQIFLHQTKHPADSVEYGDMTLAVDAKDGVSYQEYWYRGGWYDFLERYWRNFTEDDELKNRHYDEPGYCDTATISVKQHAEPGETVRYRFIISWNRPNNYNYWNRLTEKDENGNERDVSWKNYYATLFRDSSETAEYALKNWDMLWSGTKQYHDELFASTLPDEVTEAISATVSVLKTATVLRLENGEFYGWEGMGEQWGSCEGTCTHVWNYAYALCFLFPQLERTIRETDFKYNQDVDGRMAFRMQLPLGRGVGGFRACVDGQMGGVVKTYREWKLSGDDEWLRGLWGKVKKSLEYAWSESNYDRWDRDHDGVLEGRQHHTLDMELFGPSSWLEGFYLAALKCGAEMAERMGEPDSAAEYMVLYNKGKKWCDENLFNGKWYTQKIDLCDHSILETFGPDAENYWNSESGEIKYQIGEGSEIDQCLAAWHANINGIGEIYDKEQLHTALGSMWKNNYMTDMRSHYNTFRLFAVNDEAGAVICAYPDGTTVPAIPIPYAQETMHGFEYSLAGLMISEGMIDEGLTIVKSVRDRYRGYNRNPYNEIECGSNYARSMASFALLPIFSGFRFNMPDSEIGFAPIVDGDFRAPWFVGRAWGSYTRTAERTEIKILDGELRLKTLLLPYLDEVKSVSVDGKDVEFAFENGRLCLDVCARREIEIK
ncbi:MAG: GH116 family glycosyl hydrolase, partial [Eubacteriales bacterium]